MCYAIYNALLLEPEWSINAVLVASLTLLSVSMEIQQALPICNIYQWVTMELCDLLLSAVRVDTHSCMYR